jgi:hypothetical protein
MSENRDTSFESKVDLLIVDVAVIKEKVSSIEEKQKSPIRCAANEKIIEDHENRIRKNESFRTKTSGAMIILQDILSVAVALIVKFL